jgi:hypothetical protein
LENSKITSFANLVSWSFFVEHKNQLKYWRIEVDSVSLELILRLFGIKKLRFSGVQWVQENRDQINLGLVLGTVKVSSYTNHFILPLWKDIGSIDISNQLKQLLSDFNGRNIYIGISSPKQEHLALKIREISPQSNIYCLGAALYVDFENKNFLWLIFLLRQPKRTIHKLSQTAFQIIKFIRKANREKLKELFK